ncbi:MAG: GAF domain-containing sensor histidine kinase [Chloroflexota bacterium]|nr:GAF domain-containing sensor histidine kinase [Chloroflexota bacterium]
MDRQTSAVFRSLLLYRWGSLLAVPALWALAPNRPGLGLTLALLALAAANNAIPTLFHRQLNRLVLHYPLLFLADLVFSAALIGASGGARSAYYLYAFGPLLGAGLFYEVEGGLLVAAVFSLLYTVALYAGHTWLGQPVDQPWAATSIASYFLIAGLFGFSSRLLDRSRRDAEVMRRLKDDLQGMNHALRRSNGVLEAVQDLGIAMQSTIEPEEVQEKVLFGLIDRLGFDRAVLGLVEVDNGVLTNWLMADRRQEGKLTRLRYAGHIQIDPASADPISRAIAERAPRRAPVSELPDPAWFEQLGLRSCAVVPLISRDNELGVVIVDNSPSGREIGPEDLRSVLRVANQGALALANVRLCMERTYKLAVEEERNRIAMEIHDVVFQSLSGLVFNLDGCGRLLPERAAEVKGRLADLSGRASKTLAEVRKSIFDLWPPSGARASFAEDLRESLLAAAAASPSLRVDVKGQLAALNQPLRRALTRVAKEAVANAAKHAGASEVNVCLEIGPGDVNLVVQDNGQGFDLASVYEQRAGLENLGLVSMQDRVEALGGQLTIESAPGQGTSIRASIGRSRAASHVRA